jgi:hypothetical protein
MQKGAASSRHKGDGNPKSRSAGEKQEGVASERQAGGTGEMEIQNPKSKIQNLPRAVADRTMAQ